MTDTELKTLIKGRRVQFSRYRKGYLYYTINDRSDADLIRTFEFPVPIEDVGDATFGSTEKAILFMRYIRKAQQEGSFVRAAT